ncbi:hypothetical protein LTR66_010442 [Elasticomyces elasticus]|nr:hypothetical protein LTR66_010442 [Elasticomyces elasticus]
MSDGSLPRPAPAEVEAPQTPGRPSSPPSLRTGYLILYNFVSTILWLTVLGRVALTLPLAGTQGVRASVAEFAKWTQTLAVLEVGHAVSGIVRAPLLTTIMQVASRLLLVWGIVHNFPATTTASPLYSSMLLAWSATEVVRYSYFVASLWGDGVPRWLLWLRYNMFFVLYPLGIASECWLVYKAIAPARTWNLAWEYVLRGILFVYIPGSYVLFTHMMAQRRKVMRGLRERKDA